MYMCYYVLHNRYLTDSLQSVNISDTRHAVANSYEFCTDGSTENEND